MERVLTIKGEESGNAVVLELDGNPKSFLLESSISGQDIYDLLDFKANTQYKLENQGCGGINDRPYCSFVKLIEKIIEELNQLEIKPKNEITLEDNNQQQYDFDEEIPF